MANDLNQQLTAYIKEKEVLNSDNISEQRKKELEDVAFYLKENMAGGVVKLNFICTHNSRRSHFGQVWAQTAAHYYGFAGIKCYSGGTEATAFNPRAVAALERAGFSIFSQNPDNDNPLYKLKFYETAPEIVCFSKKYDDEFNPRSGFVAIMTCNQADEACPIVHGAQKRFSITYEDPKVADNTPNETSKYDERCEQIAREMFYLFSKV